MVPLLSDAVNVTTQCATVPPARRPTFIVEVPEIVRAPLVVKVPATLGNVEKSYTAVMVTGTSVDEPADAVGAEPIVKKAVMHKAIAADKILFCRITNILFFML
jgi:hypothetical protein